MQLPSTLLFPMCFLAKVSLGCVKQRSPTTYQTRPLCSLSNDRMPLMEEEISWAIIVCYWKITDTHTHFGRSRSRIEKQSFTSTHKRPPLPYPLFVYSSFTERVKGTDSHGNKSALYRMEHLRRKHNTKVSPPGLPQSHNPLQGLRHAQPLRGFPKEPENLTPITILPPLATSVSSTVGGVHDLVAMEGQPQTSRSSIEGDPTFITGDGNAEDNSPSAKSEVEGRKRNIPVSLSTNSLKGRNLYERSFSPRNQSRRGSKIMASGSRLGVFNPEIAPSVKNAFYISGRRPPVKLQPRKFIEKTLSTMSLPQSPSHFESSFKRELLEKDSLEIFHDMFWFVHCLFFQSDSETHQEILIDALSSKFIQFFLPIHHRDLFMQYYPFVLAYSISSCFQETFPTDRGSFDSDFRRDILHIGEMLYCGVRLSDAYFCSAEKRIFAKANQEPSLTEHLHVTDTPSRHRQKNASERSLENADLNWVQDQLLGGKMDSQTTPTKAGSHHNPVAMEETFAANKLLIEQAHETQSPSRKRTYKPLQLTSFRQMSPLVQEYVDGHPEKTARVILKSIREMLQMRRDSGLTARDEGTSKPGNANPSNAVDSKKREDRQRRMHETYTTTKDACVRDVDKIHTDLHESLRSLDLARTRVLKGGEASVSQLTMRIMENQLHRKEVMQRSLHKMGYVANMDSILHQVAALRPIEYDFASRNK